jgi:threonine dehydrogenase-like Zn-dependent dehydrogenase
VSYASRVLGKNLHFNRLPGKVSLELGAILEPLSVAMHGTRRASIKKGSTVLVFGAGAVGLLCAAMCKASEAGSVIIADIQSERVDFALKNKFADAGIVVPIKKCSTIEEKLAFAKEVAGLVHETKSITGSILGEVDAVFECTGVESCLQAAIYVNSHSKLPKWLADNLAGHSVRRQDHAHRYGQPHTDITHLSSCTPRSRPRWGIQVRQHVQRCH